MLAGIIGWVLSVVILVVVAILGWLLGGYTGALLGGLLALLVQAVTHQDALGVVWVTHFALAILLAVGLPAAVYYGTWGKPR